MERESAQPGEARTPWRRGWVVAAFVALFSLPLISDSPWADLSGDNTDHRRHAYCAWVFLHRGVDLYLLPLEEAAAGIESRHATLTWGDVPYAYPPGAVVLFIPPAILGELLPISSTTFSRLLILALSCVAVVARLSIEGAEGPQRMIALGIIAVMAMLLVNASLEGFYEAAWVLCGALAARAVVRARPHEALGWCCGAALLSYRAVALVPLGFAAAAALYRRPSGARTAWTIAGTLAVGAIVVAGFIVVSPYREVFRLGQEPLLLGAHRLSGVGLIAASAVAAGPLVRGSPVTAATLVLSTLVVAVDLRAWWHGSLLLPVPLAFAVDRRGGAASIRPWLVVLLWLLVAPKLAYGRWPFEVFKSATRCVLRSAR